MVNGASVEDPNAGEEARREEVEGAERRVGTSNEARPLPPFVDSVDVAAKLSVKAGGVGVGEKEEEETKASLGRDTT